MAKLMNVLAAVHANPEEATAAEAAAREEQYKDNRWKCPECGSKAVQVGYPGWYYERKDCELVHINHDHESELLWWFCAACETSDTGKPDECDPTPEAVS